MNMELTIFITVFACLGASVLLLSRSSIVIEVKARRERELDRLMRPPLLFSSTAAPVVRC